MGERRRSILANVILDCRVRYSADTDSGGRRRGKREMSGRSLLWSVAEDVCGLISSDPGEREKKKGHLLSSRRSRRDTRTVHVVVRVEIRSTHRLVVSLTNVPERPSGISPPTPPAPPGLGSPSSLNSRYRATLGWALRNVNPEERVTLVRDTRRAFNYGMTNIVARQFVNYLRYVLSRNCWTLF